MGNLDFSANADQLKELAAYMASQINVPTIGIGGGYAPIGSINFFDATVAPQDWLACDGSVYNISDYPQLADWYEAQHGSKNFYGGDGTTTFAVPDLQGEFLRGTGTNSHTNQGSGANVGEHQDGSTILGYYVNSNTQGQFQGSDETNVLNADKRNTIENTHSIVFSGNSAFTNKVYNRVRPTNTSFLICVKAVVAGEVYSTEERVVGTWIDGKPVYQKTIKIVTTEAITDGKKYDTGITNGDVAFVKEGYFKDTYSNLYGALPFFQTVSSGILDGYLTFDVDLSDLKLKARTNASFDANPNRYFLVTIQYTKTTDG